MKRYWFIPAGIVFALAIACLFVGWVQLSLPPDAYGVVFTRARGFEKAVISPQGFTWRWDKLVPGAFTLYSFALTPQSINATVSAELPSGSVYASVAPEKPDFTVQMRLSALFRLAPEALPGLAENAHLRPDGLVDFYHALSAQIQSTAIDLALSGDTSPGALAHTVEAGIPNRFPQLVFESVSAAVVHEPDMALYERLKQTYLAMAAARASSLASAAGRLAGQEEQAKAADQKQQQNLSLLEQYGQLLDKHPSLIKFLFLVLGKGSVDMQSLDLLDKLKQLE